MKSILILIISIVSISIANAQKVTVAKKSSSGVAAITFGKYSCTATRYVSGSYEYIPRGSFVINKNGTYTYNGFNKPSSGKFTVDASGHINFAGGYLNGGKATPMEDRQNKFYLVFPTNPDSRWTCSLL